MVLKGFSTKEWWRRVLGETEEEILESLSNLKINNQEECWWDVITEEILPRLPANQLQTLRIVCQNWNRVISSPYFVQLHLTRFNESRIRVLVPWDSVMIIEYNSSDQQTKQIPYPPAIGQRESKIFLGSCDGLLCLHLKVLCRSPSRTIAMYNPSTGKCLWLQSPLRDNHFIESSWFGHHPCSGEYVLVLGSIYDEIGVYKLNRRSSLEKIHSTCCCTNRHAAFGLGFREQGVGTLLHGALHWPLRQRIAPGGYPYAISAYHLENNKYLEISIPVQRDFKLGVVDGCLFAFFNSSSLFVGEERKFEIWIMKEYEIPQSWIKYAHIQGSNYSSLLSPLGFFPNANLNLYPNRLGLIKYTFNDNRTLLLHNDPRNSGSDEAIVFPDSLVSPKIVGT